LQNISNFKKNNFIIGIISLFILIIPIFIFSSYSFADNSKIYSEIENKKLYENTYWAKLLHYRNGISEVDSNNFFVSKVGKTDIKKELFATVDSLITGKNNVLCRFPLRVKWLTENIPHLKKNIVYYKCEDLDNYLKKVGKKYVTVVFPSAHINSPASMYGHTFLKLYNSKQTPLLGYGVSYAAQATDKNGFVFAFKGIFGGYYGKYSILPYYKKIKEYRDLENRDIWEYDLNFNEDEVYKIVLHAYELKDSYSDYYFFLENCSYNLLWFLEIARNNLDLVNKFHLYATPLDTVKILQSNNIISEYHYRYSKITKMKFILKEISNKKLLKNFLNIDSNLPNSLSYDDKVRYLDFKIEYIQFLRAKNKINKKHYTKNYLKLLKLRSKFPKKEYNIKKPKNPINAHDTSKFEIGYVTNGNFILSYKPVYNDIYDVNDGYLQGAYIDFFKTSISFNQKDFYLKNLTLLNIQSYSVIDEIFKPISWGIQTGYEKFKDSEDFYKISSEIGVTLGNKDIFMFLMLNNKTYVSFDDIKISISPKIGIIINKYKNLKLGMISSYDLFYNNKDNFLFEIFDTYKISKNISLKTSYNYDNLLKNEHEIKISLFYYF
jgi:hypothetical protein